MDFSLDEELTLVRDMAREFAENELVPRAARHDRQESIDPEVFQMMGELGFWGLTVPAEYGGAGMSNVALCLVLFEINRACAATGTTLSVHNSLGCIPVLRHGTTAQKAYWLPKLAAGEAIAAYCLTEPNAGSDAAAITTSAVKDGDEWVLNGRKTFVSSGAIAGMYIVYARTDPRAKKSRGISAFLLSPATPGLSVGKHEKKTGLRGSSTTDVVLEDARAPATSILGKPNEGFHLAMETLDGGRVGIAAQAIGIGQACLEAAIKYSREREQFGQPIGNFQAIQWKLADMATRLEGARLTTLKAAWLRDRGEPCTLVAAEAKLAASTTANYCADECLQIHGGAGYTDEFPVERLFRDARITEIYEGATDIQRLVIARTLLQ
ncbi:MAG: acyl-CoA dehydrogenase family protein [Planctomycetota bacterium]